MPRLFSRGLMLRVPRRVAIIMIASGIVVVSAALMWFGRGSALASKPETDLQTEDSHSTDSHSTDNAKFAEAPRGSSDSASDSAATVSLPKSSWAVAGVKIRPAESRAMLTSVEVTGRVALNDDRIAHIFPLVEGRVDEVRVRFGQNVKAGDVLAIIQSKEVGQRKLELVQSRLARETAAISRDRAALVDRNAQELITTLEQGISVEEIETRFQGRPMGSFRERLVTAFAELGKANADFDRLTELTQRGVTASKDLMSAKAVRDAARAGYTALLDQSKFEARQLAIVAEQALREADARVAASEAALAILGYSKSDLKDIDPVQEGEAISHYPVVAPFDGTILTKDIVLMETVDTTRQLFEIADLSTVWIVADVYERHLPILEQLQGKSVEVRCDVIPDLATQAKVFFTGETVEESTRTVRLRAEAPNPDRHLKPGLFVEVALPGHAAESVVQVPANAVLEHEGRRFVFVHTGGDSFVRRDVETGERSAGQVEIVEGLAAGEAVAVEGGFALKSRLLAELLSDE